MLNVYALVRGECAHGRLSISWSVASEASLLSMCAGGVRYLSNRSLAMTFAALTGLCPVLRVVMAVCLGQDLIPFVAIRVDGLVAGAL